MRSRPTVETRTTRTPAARSDDSIAPTVRAQKAQEWEDSYAVGFQHERANLWRYERTALHTPVPHNSAVLGKNDDSSGAIPVIKRKNLQQQKIKGDGERQNAGRYPNFGASHRVESSFSQGETPWEFETVARVPVVDSSTTTTTFGLLAARGGVLTAPAPLRFLAASTAPNSLAWCVLAKSPARLMSTPPTSLGDSAADTFF